ncbi:MAG: Ku protein, partial [Candidatus Rokuibacteriota bacterium]
MAAARKGLITFGLVSIPVELHVAARPRSLDFDLLHRTCKTRIKYQLYCPTHETTVGRKDTVKGYKANGYVVMEDEDFEKAERASSRAIEVVHFVELSELDPIYLERSYYVGPQEDSERPYEVLLSALRETGKGAVVRFVMSNRQHHAVLRPREDHFVLHTIYYADEVREFEADWRRGKPGAEEVDLAARYIEALTKKFQPDAYRDEYRETLERIARAKAEGEEVVLPAAPKAAAKVVSLTDALRRSIAEVRKPPAKSAAGGRRGGRGRA